MDVKVLDNGSTVLTDNHGGKVVFTDDEMIVIMEKLEKIAIEQAGKLLNEVLNSGNAAHC